MPPELGEEMRSRPPVLSTDLAGAAMATGTARLVAEVVLRQVEGVPALTRRRLSFMPQEVLRGDAAWFPRGGLEIEGYTTSHPPYHLPDPQSPSLYLDGQRLFDEGLPAEPFQALLLVGGAPAAPPDGFPEHRAAVLDGPGAGQAARPFRLAGADRALPSALPALLGWQREISRQAVARTLEAGHPLIALDALRLAALPQAAPPVPPRIEWVEPLAAWLLHPTQPPEGRVLTLELVARVLRRLPPRSAAADALVRRTLWLWRLERRWPVAAAYLEAWEAAARQVRASTVAAELAAMALDETAAERLRLLQKRLRERLKD
jgi:hypothetical protein